MSTSVVPQREAHPNDEHTYEDQLGHHALARDLMDRTLECRRPYVVGILGSWGSGKTSFLRKMWAYLGGNAECSDDDRKRWFGGSWQKNKHVIPVWFNPWQHQFENSPMVALLQEIRRCLSVGQKALGESKKLADVTVFSALNLLGDLGSLFPKVDIKKIEDRGRQYEADQFAVPLSSQRFRELFEGAIGQASGGKTLVIFIDDLDRCEGEVAFRLLEALKLYLSAKNCVYVLGLDQKHLENAIAKVLAPKDDQWKHRAVAREYLGKMFQCQFLLPVAEDTRPFIRNLLNFPEDVTVAQALQSNFGVTAGYDQIVDVLNSSLPHNPRKIKAFLAAWKMNLLLLSRQNQPSGAPLNWRLSLFLTYLGQFEEPLFRKVEESPAFLRDHVLSFCRQGKAASEHRVLFDGLELPYASPVLPSIPSASRPDEFGSAPSQLAPAESQKENSPSPAARPFCAKELIITLERDSPVLLEPDQVRRHLVHARLG